MTHYRKKQVVIDAVQWDGTYLHAKQLEAELGLNSLGMTAHPPSNKVSWWKIATLEDGHVVSPMDWIITGVKGEHYPCKPDIFKLTYETAEAQPEQPCMGCNGHGEVGGLRSDGYYSEICPFCKGVGTEQIAQPKDKPAAVSDSEVETALQIYRHDTNYLRNSTRMRRTLEAFLLDRISKLVDLDPPKESPEGQELITLASLVIAHESQTERNFCAHCGKRLSGDGIHTCTPQKAKQ